MSGDLIVDKVAASSVATKTPLVRGLAKAWASLNGTGTIALKDSLNVASVTDNGAGDYSFNLIEAMDNANYSLSYGWAQVLTVSELVRIVNISTGTYRLNMINGSSVGIDTPNLHSNLFGDLA